MFSLLRATPLMGRVLELADEQRGNHLVVVLSHDAWQQRFGGDPDIIGRPLVLDDAPHTVVGVMPSSFYFPDHDAELWTPMVLPAQTQSPGTRRLRAFSALARLSEGVTLEQAQAEGQVVLLAQERPGPFAGLPAPTLRLIPMQEEMVGEARPALLALLAAVGFVLLIAIANLANLLLARGSARQREFAVPLMSGLVALYLGPSESSSHLALFDPELRNVHQLWGLCAASLSLALALAAWRWFPHLERRVGDASTVRLIKWAAVVVGFVAVALTMTPRRVLWDSFEIAELNGTEMYVVGATENQLLLYDPRGIDQALWRVEATDSAIRRLGSSRRLNE